MTAEWGAWAMCALTGRSRDDGMSVFEVVFAAFIMFFVLTAVLGLVGATTQLGVSAKQRNLVSNTIAARMEYARSLPFAQVDVSGSTSQAVLPTSESFSRGGYVVTVYYNVRPGDSGTKELRLTVSCAVPGRPTITSTAYSTIRDRSANITRQTGGSEGPQIEVLSSTPQVDSCVYDNLVWSPAGMLNIGVEVKLGTSGADITGLDMYLVQEGVTELKFLKSGTTVAAPTAQWSYNPELPVVREVFTWHTKQVHVDQFGNTVRTVAEGYQTIRIRARDEKGNVTTRDIRYYVDNDPPGNSGTPSVVPSTSTVARAVWTAGTDATTYELRLYLQRPAGMGGYLDPASWETSGQAVPCADLFADLTTQGFSRYVLTVLARSPRLSASPQVSPAFVSKPSLTGTSSTTYAGNGSKRNATVVTNLSVTRPTFPCTGNVSYRFEFRHPTITGGAWQLASTVTVAPGTTATLNDTRIWNIGNNAYQGIDYRCIATFTPAGAVAGGANSATSNTAGPTNPGGTPIALPLAGW